MIQLSLFDTSMRWNSHRAFYRAVYHPSQEPIDPSNFSVASVVDAIARNFVIEHHYSYPAAVAAYGMFECIAPFQEEIVGVAGFSAPMQLKAAAYGAPSEAEFCKIGRFVLRDHVGGNGAPGF